MEEIDSGEFRNMSNLCPYKKQRCEKTKFACRDFLCPLVKEANDVEEFRELVKKQDVFN